VPNHLSLWGFDHRVDFETGMEAGQELVFLKTNFRKGGANLRVCHDIPAGMSPPFRKFLLRNSLAEGFTISPSALNFQPSTVRDYP
jgi:hypothetical protein